MFAGSLFETKLSNADLRQTREAWHRRPHINVSRLPYNTCCFGTSGLTYTGGRLHDDDAPVGELVRRQEYCVHQVFLGTTNTPYIYEES